MLVDVHADVAKNRLYIRLEGEANDREAEAVGDAIIREMNRMRPGFDMVSDLTQAGPLGPAGLAQFKRILEAARERKFRRAVRIVGRSAAAALQFSRTSKELSHEAYLAFSREEAERLLDGLLP